MVEAFDMRWEPWVLLKTVICDRGAPCITRDVMSYCHGCLQDGRKAIMQSAVNVNVAVDGSGEIFALNSEWKPEND